MYTASNIIYMMQIEDNTYKQQCHGVTRFHWSGTEPNLPPEVFNWQTPLTTFSIYSCTPKNFLRISRFFSRHVLMVTSGTLFWEGKLLFCGTNPRGQGCLVCEHRSHGVLRYPTSERNPPSSHFNFFVLGCHARRVSRLAQDPLAQSWTERS